MFKQMINDVFSIDGIDLTNFFTCDLSDLDDEVLSYGWPEALAKWFLQVHGVSVRNRWIDQMKAYTYQQFSDRMDPYFKNKNLFIHAAPPILSLVQCMSRKPRKRCVDFLCGNKNEINNDI
jgi:hypothetical protein